MLAASLATTTIAWGGVSLNFQIFEILTIRLETRLSGGQ
jgi:hypothetical protein